MIRLVLEYKVPNGVVATNKSVRGCIGHLVNLAQWHFVQHYSCLCL